MYETGTLHNEIAELFRTRIDAGQIVRKGWLVHEVLLRHPLPQNTPDRDFHECCRMLAVSDAVNKVNRRFKEDAENVAEGELLLPGFVYLQKAYPIDRDGETLMVPLAQMTRDEAVAKVALYRGMASGCLGHADELERYFGDRIAA